MHKITVEIEQDGEDIVIQVGEEEGVWLEKVVAGILRKTIDDKTLLLAAKDYKRRESVEQKQSNIKIDGGSYEDGDKV